MSTIIGTVGNDSLTGTANPDSISGLNGNDTLVGGDAAMTPCSAMPAPTTFRAAMATTS
jgi:hypothetical protein